MAAAHNFFILVPLFLSFSSVAFSERCNPDDRKALLKILTPLNFLPSDPSEDCCDWMYPIKCDDKTNRVIALNFAKTLFNVSIPPAVGDLPYLESLTFHNTNVTGQIPPTIAKLSKLNFLDLRYNQLTGPVPSFLGQLKELTYIGLAFNKFTGSIPASFAQLPKLGGLLLDRNSLTGNIPESFSGFKEKELAFYFSHNQLTGPIPRKWADADFYILDVSRNKLEGDISFLFGKNKSLNIADFSRNSFQFDMSKITSFPENLKRLDLNHNKITGSLPQALAKLDFIYLNVSYNKLCGQIPVSENLQGMTYYEYSNNKCLCGAPLPRCK